ncbi:MAG TPA: hypothetical protein VFC15_18220, partial [Candidatus Limnocylindrales bacterium]|nr:hypothetical protein [Candidatus Limnocylindrales bacterium]
GDRAACSAPRIKPLAQLDDVHSILRLSYETLKGLISLASRGVAKLTRFETRLRNPRQTGGVLKMGERGYNCKHAGRS